MNDTLADFFDRMRNHPDYHLGLGDIRLTIGQQEALVARFGVLNTTPCSWCGGHLALPPAPNPQWSEEALDRITQEVQQGLSNNVPQNGNEP